MLFGKKQSKQKPPLPPPDKVSEEAWQAVPRHAPHVEMKEDRKGKLYLKFETQPGMVTERWFSRKLRLKRDRKFHLDIPAKHFWLLIDGRRTLDKIERKMRRAFGWDRKTCRRGVLQYTALLMQKKLILLDLSHRLDSIEAEEFDREESHAANANEAPQS